MSFSPSPKGTYVVVYSVLSGRKSRKDMRKTIDDFFRERHIPHRFIAFNRRTQSVRDLKISSVVSADTKGIIVVGGDGVLRSVVEHLLEEFLHVPVGFVPRGSANLFAIAHGIPSDVRAALAKAVDAAPVHLPVGVVNGKHAFLLAACFGRFAEYTLLADAGLKRAIGFGAYVVAGLQRMFYFPRHRLTLKVDAHEHEMHAHSVLVFLPSAGRTILPDMPGKKGNLRAVAFSNYSLTGLFHGVFEFYGLRKNSPRAFHAAADRVVLRGPFRGRIHLDGDHVHIENEKYEIDVAPVAVPFLL